jgi:nucleotide-binding universal stress UspA family protein
MYQRILVPIDGSPTAARGLDEAIALARLTGGELRLVHVVDELAFSSGVGAYPAYSADAMPLLRQAGEEILAKARERAEAAGVARVDTVLFESFAQRVSEYVVEQAAAWPAELIVIGTHGRRGVGRLLLGSDAERIVRSAPVPVLLVRAAPQDETSDGAQAA